VFQPLSSSAPLLDDAATESLVDDMVAVAHLTMKFHFVIDAAQP
jgi:hypothetical protein